LIWTVPYRLSIPVVKIAAEIVRLVSRRGHFDINEKGPYIFWDPYIWNNVLNNVPPVPDSSLLVIVTVSPNIARYFDNAYEDYEGIIEMVNLLWSLGCYSVDQSPYHVAILPTE
jgi:hypothetical protein